MIPVFLFIAASLAATIILLGVLGFLGRQELPAFRVVVRHVHADDNVDAHDGADVAVVYGARSDWNGLDGTGPVAIDKTTTFAVPEMSRTDALLFARLLCPLGRSLVLV